MSEELRKPAVLVVNSQVARGSVGGRASVSVLERLGFPVWFIPTVLFAWHAGHGRSTRIAPGADEFRALLADLATSPKLAEVGAVFTGYFGDTRQIDEAATLVTAVKRANPQALYLCDPIIGDSGGLFQPAAIAEAIRDRLLPLAGIATPNRYELLWNTGTEAGDNAALASAARRLRPREVVVTSAFAGPGSIGNLCVGPDDTYLATHRLSPSVPHGTGDFLAPAYLGYRLDGCSPAEALDRATAATLCMIDAAAETGADELPLAAAGDALFAAPAGVTVTHL
jgi:pyridoxine kinase